MTEAEYAPLLAQLPGWSVERDKRLVRSFRFPTYPRTIAFVNAVAAVAEEEGHHPNLSVAWGKVGVTLWTHLIDGLTDNDFILAAKIDRIFQAEAGLPAAQPA